MDISSQPKLIAIRKHAISILQGPLPFDLYVKLNDNKFTKVFNAQTALDSNRFDGYLQKGIDRFYISESSREQYLKSSVDYLKSQKSLEIYLQNETRQLLDDVTEQCVNEIYTKMKITASVADSVQFVVKIYVDLIREYASLLPELLIMARGKKNLAKHAIMTSIFSTLLAQAYDNKNVALCYNCALGGLLHDIGLSFFKNNVDEHNEGLAPAILKELFKHPIFGAQLVSQIPNLPYDVRLAVLQHHEGYDGLGYPQGLAKESISLTARIVAIAEEFVALVTGAGSHIALPPNLAAHTLARSTRLDPHLYSLFAKMLKL
jgi:HD-GYP domain-containing protein (c-di-GMP phosphodiesterase class II)